MSDRYRELRDELRQLDFGYMGSPQVFAIACWLRKRQHQLLAALTEAEQAQQLRKALSEEGDLHREKLEACYQQMAIADNQAKRISELESQVATALAQLEDRENRLEKAGALLRDACQVIHVFAKTD